MLTKTLLIALVLAVSFSFCFSTVNATPEEDLEKRSVESSRTIESDEDDIAKRMVKKSRSSDPSWAFPGFGKRPRLDLSRLDKNLRKQAIDPGWLAGFGKKRAGQKSKSDPTWMYGTFG